MKRKKKTPAEEDAERREAITKYHEQKSTRAIMRAIAAQKLGKKRGTQ